MTKPDGYCVFDGSEPYANLVFNHREHAETKAKELNALPDESSWIAKPVKIVDMEEWERVEADRIAINRASGALVDGDIERARLILDTALNDAIGKGE